MPTYTYACPACGYRVDLVRRMAHIDHVANCANCAEPLTRRPAATQGILAGRPNNPRPPAASPAPGQNAANVTLINCAAIGCGAGAVRAEGDIHLQVSNFTAIDNAGPVFQLSNGATVDADGVLHIAANDHAPPQPKKPQKRRTGRRKRRG